MFLFDTKRDDEAAEIVPYKKICVFHSRLYLVEPAPKGAAKPNLPSSRELGLWLPSRESTRANDVQAELAWDPSALTSMGECVVNPDTNKN